MADTRLADAALKLLAKTAWRDLTLAQVAKAAKLPLAKLQELRGGKSALLGLILEKLGAETASRYKPESDNARDRLFDVCLCWFESSAKRKPAIRALTDGLRFDPLTLLAEREAIVSAANWLLTLAEADTGPAPLARALALAVVMGRTIPVWLDDDAELTKTMARLDGDLGYVLKR